MKCSEAEIRNLIGKRLGVPESYMDKVDGKANFFGKEWSLSHREVLYFIFDIEKEFHILLDEEELVSADTYSISALSEIVNRKMELCDSNEKVS